MALACLNNVLYCLREKKGEAVGSTLNEFYVWNMSDMYQRGKGNVWSGMLVGFVPKAKKYYTKACYINLSIFRRISGLILRKKKAKGNQAITAEKKNRHGWRIWTREKKKLMAAATAAAAATDTWKKGCLVSRNKFTKKEEEEEENTGEGERILLLECRFFSAHLEKRFNLMPGNTCFWKKKKDVPLETRFERVVNTTRIGNTLKTFLWHNQTFSVRPSVSNLCLSFSFLGVVIVGLFFFFGTSSSRAGENLLQASSSHLLKRCCWSKGNNNIHSA